MRSKYLPRLLIGVICVMLSARVFADAYDMVVYQRVSTDTYAANYNITPPASFQNGIFIYDGTNRVAAISTLSGLTLSSNVLSATPTWSSITAKPNTVSGYGITDAGATVNYPTTRSLALGTAYQCTDNANPCVFSINLDSTSSISLGGTSNNEGDVTIGTTTGVISGTGTQVCHYRNNLGGTLVIGLTVTSRSTQTCSASVPIGGYIAMRQIAGSGLIIDSAFDQKLN